MLLRYIMPSGLVTCQPGTSCSRCHKDNSCCSTPRRFVPAEIDPSSRARCILIQQSEVRVHILFNGRLAQLGRSDATKPADVTTSSYTAVFPDHRYDLVPFGNTISN